MSNFYNSQNKQTYTEANLLLMGYPTDTYILSKLGVYPISYEYVSFDEFTQKQVLDGEPLHNGKEYVQHFKVEELVGEELEYGLKRKHIYDLEQEEQSLLKYLDNTDWYVVRFSEKGEPIPEEITVKREESRIRIDEIRSELNPV